MSVSSTIQIRSSDADKSFVFGQDSGKIVLNFNIASNVICWSFHAILTQSQYTKITSPINLRVSSAHDPNINTTDAGERLVPIAQFKKSNTLAGYAACRFPNNTTDNNYVSGSWTARIFGNDIPFTDYNNIRVWLCQKVIQPNLLNYNLNWNLKFKFILIAHDDDYSKASNILQNSIDYMRKSVYGPCGIKMDIYANGSAEFVAHQNVGGYNNQTFDASYLSLSNLITEFQDNTLNSNDNERVHVYLFTRLTFTEVDPPGALGFSMRPGPQGFFCTQGGIIIRIRVDADDGTYLALRIAHETGHYLGLTHESACMGAYEGKVKPTAYGDFQICQMAFSPNDSNNKYVRTNLMTTGFPSKDLAPEQIFMMKTAPIVSIISTDNTNKTLINSMYVSLHTGGGVMFQGLFPDLGGTDDDVYIKIYFKRFNGQQYYIEQTLKKWWLWGFATNSDMTYMVDTTQPSYLEELVKFELGLRGHNPILKITAYDAWHLAGAMIRINDIVYFENMNIDKWITNTPYQGTFTPPSNNTLRISNSTLEDHSCCCIPPFMPNPVALECSGLQNCYVSIPWPSLYIDTKYVTFQIWIQPFTTTGLRTIMSVGDLQNRIFLQINNGKYQMGIISQGTIYMANLDIPSMDLNNWTHLCGTYDGVKWTLYRNGQIGDQCTAPPLSVSVNTGLLVGISNGFNDPFQGRLRNVCVWRTARTSANIINDIFDIDAYNTNVIGYWPLDDRMDDNACDLSPLGNDGVITNTNWYVSRTLSGNCLNCSSVNGSSSYGSVKRTNKMDRFTGDITIASWVYIGAQDINSMIGERTIVGTQDCSLRIVNNTYRFGMNTSSIGVNIDIEDGDLRNWIHLSGQYSTKTKRWSLYKNGFLVAFNTGPGYGQSLNSDWYFGGHPSIVNVTFFVQIKMVWCFNMVITIDNLRDIYMNYKIEDTLPPQSYNDGLLFLWPFNEGIGNLFLDNSKIEPVAHGNIDPSVIGWGASPFYMTVCVNTTQSIQAVMDSIHDASQSKRYNIYLAPGVFSIDTSITLKPWICLVGSGKYITDIKLTNIGIHMADFTTLRQFSILCGRTLDASKPLIAIYLESIEWILIDNLYASINCNGVAVETMVCFSCNNSQQIGISNSELLSTNTLSQGGAAFCTNSNVNIYNINLESDGKTCFNLTNNSNVYMFDSQVNIDNLSNNAIVTDESSYVTASNCQIVGACQGNVNEKI
jgi:hypothetical protein